MAICQYPSLSSVSDSKNGPLQRRIHPLLLAMAVLSLFSMISNTSMLLSVEIFPKGLEPSISFEYRKDDLKTRQKVVARGETVQNRNTSAARERTLQFSELTLGPFEGNGAINVVSQVELPFWWYRQHNVSKEEKFVVKLAAGGDYRVSLGDREVQIWRLLWSNRTEAKRNRIVPLVYSKFNFTNPFLAKNANRTIPDSFPENFRQRLLTEPNLVAMVLPYLPLEHPSDRIHNFSSLKKYFKSLLEILVYAHSLEINNFDLYESNAKIDENGLAVITDWNAMKLNGEDIYDSTANLRITGPEGLLEHSLDKHLIRQTHLHAMDIWSVGVMLADSAFRPCRFLKATNPPRQRHFPRNIQQIRDLLSFIGGNAVIPIGNNKTLDLVKVVGWNSSQNSALQKKQFELPLRASRYSLDKCDLSQTFAKLDGATDVDLQHFQSLLKLALKLSPADRPEAATLLEHPFFTNEQHSEHQHKIEDDAITEKYLRNPKLQSKRQLTFGDIQLGRFIGNGAVNLVCEAILPKWFYTQEKIPLDRRFVAKVAAGGEWRISQGNREVEIWDTLWKNVSLALKHRIVPFVYLQKNFPNPFQNLERDIPASMPSKYQLRLRHEPELVVMVLPYLDLDRASEYVETLEDIQIYLKSLLEILVYSHRLGVNNFDLSDSNVKIDEDGKAVVTDWNAAKRMGQEIFDTTANLHITAPEGMIEYYGDEKDDVVLTSMSAMDIWGVAVMGVNLAMTPVCSWASPATHSVRPEYPKKYNLIRYLVQSIGGNTVIDVDNDETLDLAELLELNSTFLKSKEFELPLLMNSNQMCDKAANFPKLAVADELDVTNFYSFLESALKISPNERPDAATLLQHAFFTNSSWNDDNDRF
jgi:serine/threonine protein kinase